MQYLILGYASVSAWGNAGCAMQHFSSCSSCSPAHTDVRIVQEQRHVVAHKVKQTH